MKLNLVPRKKNRLWDRRALRGVFEPVFIGASFAVSLMLLFSIVLIHVNASQKPIPPDKVLDCQTPKFISATERRSGGMLYFYECADGRVVESRIPPSEAVKPKTDAP